MRNAKHVKVNEKDEQEATTTTLTLTATEERRSVRCDVSTLNERKINIRIGSCSVFGRQSLPYARP